MGDDRNPRRPEVGIDVGAWNLLGEFRRECSKNGRTMHADLLENAPAQHRHASAAARLAGMVGSRPWVCLETAGLRRRVGIGTPTIALEGF